MNQELYTTLLGYNVKEYLDRCIKLNQTFKDLELIQKARKMLT